MLYNYGKQSSHGNLLVFDDQFSTLVLIFLHTLLLLYRVCLPALHKEEDHLTQHLAQASNLAGSFPQLLISFKEMAVEKCWHHAIHEVWRHSQKSPTRTTN